ncbi:MAG: DUF6798 domain-containing protein [Anaerolineaceae bacterium]
MKNFHNFVTELNRCLWKRLLLFSALTMIAILINGYHFGTFDQVFHIPFFKSYQDPTLYSSDPFLQLKDYHFSYFWSLFIPAYRAGLFEPALFITHVLVTFATFWAFWDLCETMFHNPTANVLMTLALTFPHLGFPGFQIIEFSLLNRTFALPFLLWALSLYFKKQYFWSALLIGLMFNIHLVYTAFVIALIGMDLLLNIRRLDWKRLIPAFLIFGLLFIPMFMQKQGVAPGLDFTLRPELAKLESSSTLYTVYYPIGPQPYVLAGTLQGIACAAIILLSIRHHPISETDKTMRSFLIAIAVVITVGSLAAWFLPVTFIIQFQMIRIGVFLLYFAYLYFAYLIAKTLENEHMNGWFTLLLVFSYVVVIFPVVPLIIWLLRNTKLRRISASTTIASILLIAVVEIGVATAAGLFSPGIHIYGLKSDWRSAQDWARENTPKDTLFITPPYIFWHYESDWRVFSERGTVVTISESLELHYDPAFTEEYVTRMNDVAPGAIEKFNSNYNDTFRYTQEAFETLEDADFSGLAQKYGADYLVLPNTTPSDLPIVYQNPTYSIYQLN